MEYLLFRLYGSLASWGEIAVGSSRHTASYPSKSALIGLIAAACGIKREDEKKQIKMFEAYRFAVKVISTGTLLRDYHTTQVPPRTALKNSMIFTRKDELKALKEYQKKVNHSGTILSSREYRCDALAVVAVEAKENPPYTLKELEKDYLRNPRYHLYLGRKSCPLAVSLNPQLVIASGFKQAFNEYKNRPLFISSHLLEKIKRNQKEINGVLAESPLLEQLSHEDKDVLSLHGQQVRYYWEGDSKDLAPQQTITRHDQPLSRNRWQFTQREENLLIEEVNQCTSQE